MNGPGDGASNSPVLHAVVQPDPARAQVVAGAEAGSQAVALLDGASGDADIEYDEDWV